MLLLNGQPGGRAEEAAAEEEEEKVAELQNVTSLVSIEWEKLLRRRVPRRGSDSEIRDGHCFD